MAEPSSSQQSKASSKRSAKGSSKKSSKKSPASDSATRSRGQRVLESVGDKAQTVLKRDYNEARVMAQDAMRSRAYLYPFKGVVYFFSNRDLRTPFLKSLVPFATLSVAVLTGMLMLAYLPQFAVLLFVHGPLAVFTTLLLILSESSAIISVISRVWFLRDALLDTFDATLISRRHTDIVGEGREINPGDDSMQKLGRIRKFPLPQSSPTAALRYLLYLPLNCIPIVGTFMFLFFQGRRRGQVCHDRYFQLKDWPSSKRLNWLDTHLGSYTSYVCSTRVLQILREQADGWLGGLTISRFGVVAILFEMVPLLSILFTYTNTVGAALWAADLEDNTSALTGETAPNLRQKAEAVEEDE